MNWLNLYTPFVRSPMFIGSEPIIRSTWLSLVCYCCEQENGGLIVACGAWKDRQWQQTCGVTLAEVQTVSGLWKWIGGDISVDAYPHEKQAEVIAKRKAGKLGGKASAKARKKTLKRSTASSFGSKHSFKHSSNGREGEGEDKGKRDELRRPSQIAPKRWRAKKKKEPLTLQARLRSQVFEAKKFPSSHA